ncbi:MAG: Shikimate kinase I, partial [uncultured Corynebacteriales bacterium]
CWSWSARRRPGSRRSAGWWPTGSGCRSPTPTTWWCSGPASRCRRSSSTTARRRSGSWRPPRSPTRWPRRAGCSPSAAARCWPPAPGRGWPGTRWCSCPPRCRPRRAGSASTGTARCFSATRGPSCGRCSRRGSRSMRRSRWPPSAPTTAPRTRSPTPCSPRSPPAGR